MITGKDFEAQPGDVTERIEANLKENGYFH